MFRPFPILLGFCAATGAFAQHNTLSQAEIAAGYELLFDGSTVSAANGDGNHWVTFTQGSETNTKIESGWKVFPADSSFGKDGIPGNPRDIRSKKKYKDFVAEFDFWSNGNSGIYYRSLVAGGFGWETGVEFAIENNTSLLSWIRSGAAYELIPASPENYRRGAWNSAKIIALGDSVEHWMNGSKVVAYKYWDAQWQRALSGQLPGLGGQRSKWNNWPHFSRPTRGATSGYIQEGYLGIQGDHAGISKFRNFKVAPITQWPIPVSLGEAPAKDADMQALLSRRIGWTDFGNGATVRFDFNAAYTATIRDISGRIRLPTFSASEPKALDLGRDSFGSGIYFIEVRIAGLTLKKPVTIR
jgi:hypothetical protein